MMVVLSGVPVLVVLSEKHPVSDRARIDMQIPILVVVFINTRYYLTWTFARW